MRIEMKSRGVVAVLAVLLAGCFTPISEVPDAGLTGGGLGGGTATGGGAAGGGGGGGVASATLELSPATLELFQGASTNIRVSSIASDGAVVDVTALADVRAEPEGIVTITQGVVRAVGPGSAMLIARLNQLEARGSVTVAAASVQKVEVSVDRVTLARGSTLRATALATLSDGSVLDVTTTATWSLENNGGNAPLQLVTPGVFLAVDAGAVRVKASASQQTGFVEVTVTDARAVSLMVTPGSAPVPVGSQVQLAAVVQYADGTVADVTNAAAWVSSAPTFEVTASGLATARAAGPASVTATFAGVSGSSSLSATTAMVQTLSIVPATLTLGVRSSAPLKVMALFDDGTSLEVTQQASFSSAQPGVASVTSTGTRGVVSALTAGNATLTARLGTLTATSQLTVTAAALQSLELSPRVVMLTSNGTSSVRARAVYTDGSQVDVSEQATWSSDAVAVATVSNLVGQRGLVSAVAGGTTSVTARLGTLTAQATITVTAPTLTSLSIAPNSITVEAGRTTQLRAMASFSDGSSRDVTSQATWSSVNTQLASVNGTGLVRALRNGTATLQAVFQGQTASGTVVVQPPTLTALSISPGALVVPVGLPAGFEATAAYSDGNTVPVSDQVTWTSSNPAVAEVLLGNGYAYVDAKQPGTAIITATLTGLAPARATVTVTSATLIRLEVSPAQPTLPVGAYTELNASGIYSDNTTQYLRYASSWASSNPAVAAVGNTYQDKGWVSALSAGTTTITVTFNGVTASTVLTVTAATLTELQVTPFAPNLPIGFDTYLRATGLYSDNTTRDLSYFVSWTSSAPGIASVGSYGYTQPLLPGAATITAAYNGMQGTTQLTVTSATLTSITLASPSAMPLGIQETRRLTARGNFSDGSMLDVTPYVTWLSSAAPVASVSNAWPTQGEVKGLSAGSATITAVRGAVSVTAPVTVQ